MKRNPQVTDALKAVRDTLKVADEAIALGETHAALVAIGLGTVAALGAVVITLEAGFGIVKDEPVAQQAPPFHPEAR